MMFDNTRDRCRHGSFTMMCTRYASDAAYLLVCIPILVVVTWISTMLSLLRPMGRSLAFLMRQVDVHSTEDL